MGTIYKVNCKLIKEIEVLSKTFFNKNRSLCFEEQPIKFSEDNNSRTGFLTQDGVIKSYIANDYQIQFSNLDYLANKIREPLLSHNSLLMESTDLLSSFQEVVNHEMSARSWYTHMSDTSNIKSKIIDVKVAIENTLYL
ncbi:unnamed protein product [Brachionus calyciflorus]|uniref:Uncharacterized protein n=1 Tax=Brachionus calyciflorus TaxID=104777 RepID=A0A813PSL0_9BILA|nr:unnamed protein product [Brachionus calyciflorus]